MLLIMFSHLVGTRCALPFGSKLLWNHVLGSWPYLLPLDMVSSVFLDPCLAAISNPVQHNTSSGWNPVPTAGPRRECVHQLGSKHLAPLKLHNLLLAMSSMKFVIYAK